MMPKLNDISFLCTYPLRSLNIDFTDNEVNQYINELLISDYEELLI